jgi:L-amino acid N-acyltransferase YncA
VIRLRPLEPGDWGSVRDIYAAGIATGDATFETEPPDWEAWNAGHLPTCRFVAVLDEEVVGWAALSPVSDRCVYAGVAEVSVYVDPHRKAMGVGTRLLERLISASEEEGLWTLQAGIFPENVASIELHRKLGFRVVGTRERLGKMKGRWRDVVLLERRRE